MAEYVRMPKAHYEAACNSIRAKTGKTDLIKSGAMSAEIDSITTGGGSSDDVRYVTFMNHDGTVEYGKLPVAVGYDCPNPKFDDPTRESDVQFDYTFAGWATTVNGGLNSKALSAVTEDRTVYANFVGTARIYTATFYDGNIVIGTSKAAYGTQATPPDTTKAGYTFDSWTPSDLTLYGDTSFVGNWVELPAYAFVTSMTGTNNNNDVTINNAGTKVVTGAAYPAEVFDISGDTPTMTAISTDTKLKHNVPRFSADDSKLHILGGINNPGRIIKWEYDPNTLAQTNLNTMQTSSYTSLASYVLELVPGGYFYSHNIKASSGTTYVNKFTYSGGVLSLGTNTSAKDCAFSLDGKFGAVGFSDNTVKVFQNTLGSTSITNATLKHTISVGATIKSVSFNMDGTKLAVGMSSAPYVSIYDTSTGELICDLSEVWSVSCVCAFVPNTNDLIVGGTDGIVRLFDMSGTTPQENKNVPAYDGGSVAKIRPSKNGSRIAILSFTKNIHVWKKTK